MELVAWELGTPTAGWCELKVHYILIARTCRPLGSPLNYCYYYMHFNFIYMLVAFATFINL